MDEAAFLARLKRRAEATDAVLEDLLPRSAGPAGRVASAMRHAALGGGKRVRAYLVLESAALFGAHEPGALRAAAALECVHAYSLVHDDLPAMDDDDLRRGRPTAHIAFGEAAAILAGDALQALAFEILAAVETHQDPAVRCALISDLTAASGAEGMVGGQMRDLDAEESGARGASAALLDLDDVIALQRLKTGKLIIASALAGARLGGAGAAETTALEIFADRLGLAFQIKDDLLDVEGDEAAAGKRLGKDASAGKATFVGLLGAEGARQAAADRAAEAEAALQRFGDAAAPLRAAAAFAINRKA
ncbi:MAG: polyprenyl synthetase family protein [Pseudomonadota bacterium]